MGLEIGQDAVFYIILMLVVILIGVSYATGFDLMKLFSGGGDQFASPTVEITSTNIPSVQRANGYVVSLAGLTIDYKSSEERSVVIYPILDFGNNPLFEDSGKEIECTYNGKKFDCGSPGTLTYTLRPDKLQSIKDFGENRLVLQLYFFKKNEEIKRYIKDMGSGETGRTTSNLLKSYSDFYIYNTDIGIVDTLNDKDMLSGAYCQAKSGEQCTRDGECYIPYEGECASCRDTDCEDYSEAECMKCNAAKERNCRWMLVDSAYACRSG